MTELRPITTAKFRERFAQRRAVEIDQTKKPRLHWIAIDVLRVDPRYQRDLNGDKSAKNIIEIAANFSWQKFAPCVVAEVEEGLFAIIDGQHRTTAAALRQIRDVPCLIVDADVADQAGAFAAINGNVTAVSPLQMHAARLAAGDGEATVLTQACAEAGVTICRYPIPAYDMKVGETLAVHTLGRQLKRYGRELFIAALSCITKTGDGNIGFVRAQVTEALMFALSGEPSWASDLARLLKAMADFDFAAAFNNARVIGARDGGGVAAPLIEAIGEHLEARLPVSEAAE
jgi:hypothetical protein